jgi:hypothetical protein
MEGIAIAESGGYQYALGDAGHSRGFWQINDLYWSSSTFDPYGNARAAVEIEALNGLNSWTTYSDGAYLNYCGN